MEITFMQPLMLECDESGCITSVRVLQMIVEANNVSFYNQGTLVTPKKQEDVPENILWSHFNELQIVKCLEKHVRTISTAVVGNRYLAVRNALCNRINYENSNGICGVRCLPVKRADGVICHQDMITVIAKHKHSAGSIRNAAGYLFFDYKGKVYTEQQLCASFDWAHDELARLYRDEFTTHFANESSQSFMYNRPAVYKRLAYALPLKTRDAMLATLVPQADITITDFDDIIQFSQVITQERQPCYIYEHCRTAKIQVEPPVKLWQLQGHNRLEKLQITGSSLPILFKNINKLYDLGLAVEHSYAPLDLPAVAMAPGDGVTSMACISISQPYVEEYVDYSSRICDCKMLRVYLGTQQSKRVTLPDASYLSYTATLNIPSFMLVVNKMRREYSAASMDADPLLEYNEIEQGCKIGLALGTVQNVYLDFQQAQQSMIDITLKPLKNSGNTVILAKLPKHLYCLTLGSSVQGISENIYGGDIENMTYYNDIWQTNQRNDGAEALHVYAHVRHLQIYTHGEIAQKPIYMHDGIDDVEIISTCNEYKRYARCIGSIHVPKKSRVQVCRKEHSGEMEALSVVVPYVVGEPSECNVTTLTNERVSKYSLKDETMTKAFIAKDL